MNEISNLQKERHQDLIELEKLKNSKINMEEEENYQEETDFGGREDDNLDWDNYTALDWIEDPHIKEKTRKILENTDLEYHEKNPHKYNNALLDAISSFQISDSLLNEEWDKDILKDEKNKLKWETKLFTFNDVFKDRNLNFPFDNKKVKDFFNENIEETYTDKKEEINGYTFLDKKIIKRNKNRAFSLVEGPMLERFVKSYSEAMGDSASNVFIENLGGVSKNSEDIKSFADNYIFELREEQKKLISEMKPSEEIELRDMKNNVREINDIEKEIDDIKKNSKFKIRVKVWRTIGGFLSNVIRGIKRYGKKLGAGVIVTIIAILVSIGAFIAQIELEMNKGASLVDAIGKKMADFKKFILSHQGTSLAIVAGILGWFLGLFGKIFPLIIYLSSFLFTRVIIIFSGVIGTLILIFTNTLDGVKSIFSFLNLESLKLRFNLYLMADQEAPDDVVFPLAKKKGITPKEFRELFSGQKNYYNSTIAVITSNLSGPFVFTAEKLTKGGEKVAEKTEEVVTKILSFLQNHLKIIFIILIIFIIIKWRN